MEIDSEKRKIKRFASFKSFIFSKVFLINLLIAIALGFVLLFGSYFLLDKITHHGEALSVPDFSGMNFSEAKLYAAKKNINVKIIDSVFSAPGKKGTVIAQIPPPGFKVKEDRTILLTVKTVNPERIQMPDFRGVSLIQAKADIETYGLRIGRLKYVPDIATNNVLDQIYHGKQISPGTWIVKNSVIDLILGMGKSDKFSIVPSLIGLNLLEAKGKAASKSLNIGAIIFDVTIKTKSDSMNAIIYKQDPSKNRQITIGSPIDIWLTLDMNKIDSDL